MLRLHLNEAPFPPAPGVIKAITENAGKVNLYMIGEQIKELREALGSYVGVDPEYITLIPGSGSFLEYLQYHIALRKMRLITTNPTFFIILRHVERLGIDCVKVPLRPELFELKLDELLARVRGEGDFVYLSNPNNPSGNLLLTSEKDVRSILDTGATLILDEVYYEFNNPTFAHLIKDYENLVIIRSFSKSFALAGMRIGYIVGRRSLIERLSEFRPTMDLPILSVPAAIAALRELSYYREKIEELIKVREQVISELNSIPGVRALSSRTNFFLMRVEGFKGEELAEILKRKSVLVHVPKYFPELSDYVRVAVSSKEVMEEFVKVIREVVSAGQ